MYQTIERQAYTIACELLEQARLEQGGLLVVGCSSSEVIGQRIGSASSPEVAQAIFAGILPAAEERGVFLAAQCCEHLNRALILEREAARLHRLEPVNVVPQPKAGGSFATAAYAGMRAPCAVESVRARAGIDIGDTLIGMHLVPVAVPVRPSIRKLGEANVVCARTRPRFIGGIRAHYDEALL